MMRHDLIIGIPLCLAALLSGNMSKIFIKLIRKADEDLEKQGYERGVQSTLNKFYVAAMIFFLSGFALDIASQTALDQMMWSSICAYDVIAFHLFNAMWFCDTLEIIQASIVGSFTLGAILTTLFHPMLETYTKSGWEEFTSSWDDGFSAQIIFWICTFVMLGLSWLCIAISHQAKRFQSHRHPIAPSKLIITKWCIAIVKGISAGALALFMFILTNTIFIPDTAQPSAMDYLLSIFMFILCYVIHLMTNWACYELHANVEDDMTATLMIATLFQISAGANTWGISFQQPSQKYWISGIVLEGIALTAWLFTYSPEGQEEENAKSIMSIPVLKTILSSQNVNEREGEV